MTRKSPAADRSRTTISSFFTKKEELRPGLALHFSMPAVQPAACLALLDLLALSTQLPEQHASQHLTSLLSPAEKKLFAAFTYPKRQREWLGGRLACKYAVLHLAATPAAAMVTALSILPAANGAPLLSCPSQPDHPLPAISISHSDRYAVAIAAQAETCGIDLQKISSQTVRVADRFAEPAEVRLLRQTLPHLDEMERLTLLWAAKEALKKGLLRDRPTLFQGVTLLSVNRDQHLALRLRYPDDGGQPATITAVAFAEYILAYTIRPHHA